MSAVVERLGPEGRAVWDLLTNRDPDRVPALIAELPPQIRAEINALDLAQYDLSRLDDVTFVIIHGEDDPILPASGSRALATALPDADLYIVDALGHVEAADIGDSLTLLRATYTVLGLRDGG